MSLRIKTSKLLEVKTKIANSQTDLVSFQESLVSATTEKNLILREKIKYLNLLNSVERDYEMVLYF